MTPKQNICHSSFQHPFLYLIWITFTSFTAIYQGWTRDIIRVAIFCKRESISYSFLYVIYFYPVMIFQIGWRDLKVNICRWTNFVIVYQKQKSLLHRDELLLLYEFTNITISIYEIKSPFGIRVMIKLCQLHSISILRINTKYICIHVPVASNSFAKSNRLRRHMVSSQ